MRHAKTCFNTENRITGQMDIGIEKDVVIDAVCDFEGIAYSSPLKRCRQTLKRALPVGISKIIYDNRRRWNGITM